LEDHRPLKHEFSALGGATGFPTILFASTEPGNAIARAGSASLSHRTSQMSATVSEVELDCTKPSPAEIDRRHILKRMGHRDPGHGS
jgi:hypothetical protein